MHRTTFLPRFLARRYMAWSLYLGFALCALATRASAQGPGQPFAGFGQQVVNGGAKEAKAATEPAVLVLPKETTRKIEMSTKELIQEVRSENPKVVKVQTLIDEPRAILVIALSPGTSRVFLTDVKKNTESLEIRVPQGDEEEREAKRRDLLEQIHKAVPTAVVDVIVPGSGAIVLTGTVPHSETVHVIQELAHGVFGQAANVVNGLRVGGVQQVQVEVTIARVNRSKFRSMGLSFLNTGQHHFLASTIGGAGNVAGAGTLTGGPGSILSPTGSLTASPNAVFGIFNDKQSFMQYLTALNTEGLAKVMSEPRVMTLSGRQAWIVSGGETPILTTSGTGAPSVTYKTFGTIVNFLPIVLGNGKIHMEVRPEISSLNAAAGITIPSAVGVTSVPGFDLRSAQVTVQMEDGQTLAIGGLIQNTLNAQNNKVPILGDIPVLGFAFSSKTYTEVEEELIILVTPHLVDSMACCQLPKYLPGRETRRADDFELFLEGILEAPRGQRQVGHPYTPAYMNSHTTANFPCGDLSGGIHGRKTCAPNCAPGCAPSGSTNCTTGSCANGACTTGTCANGTCAPVTSAAAQQPQQGAADARTILQTLLETPDPVQPPAPTMLPAVAQPRPSE